MSGGRTVRGGDQESERRWTETGRDIRERHKSDDFRTGTSRRWKRRGRRRWRSMESGRGVVGSGLGVDPQKVTGFDRVDLRVTFTRRDWY